MSVACFSTCPENTRGEGDFLRALFRALNKSDIDYAVMRNYEALPHSCGDTDLDILVAEAERERILSVIASVASETSAILLGVSEDKHFVGISILGTKLGTKHLWWGVKIDVFVGLFFKGFRFLDDKQPLPVKTYNEVNVLTEGFAGVIGVLKEALHNDQIPKRYLQSARFSLLHHWQSVEELLSPIGPNCLSILKRSILEGEGSPKHHSESVRKAFYKFSFTQHPLAYIIGRYYNVASKLARYFRPSGTVIAILGTDGAGKSTVIDAIKPALDQATHNATVVRHLRPDFLPPLASLKGISAAETGPVVNPHGAKPSGALGSLMRISYATVNYVLGYWFDTRLQIAKQPNIVLFDRYAYDMAIDPARFRISLPSSIVRFFVRLAPTPDLVFCLVGSPQVLAARKKELPLEEVARQVDALTAFSENEPRAILVDTEQSVEQCRDEVLQAIVDHCRSKGGL